MKQSFAVASLLLLLLSEAHSLAPSPNLSRHLGPISRKATPTRLQKGEGAKKQALSSILQQAFEDFNNNDWSTQVAKAVGTATITAALTLGNPSIPSLHVFPQTAMARVAPLADVGLR
jgi:hypothetical protein